MHTWAKPCADLVTCTYTCASLLELILHAHHVSSQELQHSLHVWTAPLIKKLHVPIQRYIDLFPYAARPNNIKISLPR